jgi:DNA-binding NarL/FixJ family response regulator
VLLAEDHDIVREGTRQLLERAGDLAVVGEAGDGEEAVRLAEALRPDVVVMDIEIPNQDGIALSQAMRQLVPESKVIILSLQDDPLTQARARDAGVEAFVEKRGGALPLLTAIRIAASRETKAR